MIASSFSIDIMCQALATYTPKAPERVGVDKTQLRPAGVLVPLYPRDSAWHLLLCRRSDLVSEHQGEMAFPGGRLEQDDTDLLQCALREGWEEVGIRSEDVTVVGQLDAVTTRTGYLVAPTVVTLPDSYGFVPNEREVAELIEVPLHWLLDYRSVRHEALLQVDGSLVSRFAYAVGPHLVFGATSLILSQLLGLYAQAADGASSQGVHP